MVLSFGAGGDWTARLDPETLGLAAPCANAPHRNALILAGWCGYADTAEAGFDPARWWAARAANATNVNVGP